MKQPGEDAGLRRGVGFVCWRDRVCTPLVRDGGMHLLDVDVEGVVRARRGCPSPSRGTVSITAVCAIASASAMLMATRYLARCYCPDVVASFEDLPVCSSPRQ